jgi:cellulose synthase/poly-beta-1,6-N-acetylglucosamine synthase-like glycosyltransferase
MWMNCIFIGTALLFVSGTLAALWHLRWLRRLPPLESSTADEAIDSQGESNCSVIVAAKDEAATIEQTVRRLLAQGGVALELIVVDDRSTDRTGEILEQLAKEDPRLKVISVEALPEGWLGKCHACHLGASAAKGEWIVFIDADCCLKPVVLLRAVRVAELERADHVTLTPGRTTPSLGVRATALLFHLSCVNLISGVNRDRPKSYLGLGAFNLVRATAYRQCGGYEALRLTALDDVKLGLLLRRTGKRTRAFLGADDVQAHWGTNTFSTIALMEKNYFAAFDFRLSLALGVGACLTLLVGGVVLGAAWGTGAGLTAALSPFGLVVPAAILARRLGWSWSVGLGVPLVVPVFLCALLNSTAKTLWRGGIRWRNTFYPLETLRAGNVR